MPLRIGLTSGDVTGIGPEVALKALARELPLDQTRYVVFGDGNHLAALNSRLRLGLTLVEWDENSTARLQVMNPGRLRLPEGLPPGSGAAALCAVDWLRDGATSALAGQIHALVTAPVNKASIIRAGDSFVGQTEFLSQLARANRTAMMLLGHDDRGRWLRVALATTHLPLRAVPDQLSAAKIATTIELASEACALLGLPRAKIGVCGLNPHAGESCNLGTEDHFIIAPAVAAARAAGINVEGPVPADTLFYHAFRGEFEAVVAMYHDQGLAPLKMIAFETGVNWTLGLPFIRTSPDHGTAYDIAGRGIAHPGSMIAALQLAKRLALARIAPPGTLPQLSGTALPN
jgi:4-hydroxythreonine-4-phosphate dehydrogenase